MQGRVRKGKATILIRQLPLSIGAITKMVEHHPNPNLKSRPRKARKPQMIKRVKRQWVVNRALVQPTKRRRSRSAKLVRMHGSRAMQERTPINSPRSYR